MTLDQHREAEERYKKLAVELEKLLVYLKTDTWPRQEDMYAELKHISRNLNSDIATLKRDLLRLEERSLLADLHVQGPAHAVELSPVVSGSVQSMDEAMPDQDKVTRRRKHLAVRMEEVEPSPQPSEDLPVRQLPNETLNLDPSLLRSQLNSMEQSMMREILETTHRLAEEVADMRQRSSGHDPGGGDSSSSSSSDSDRKDRRRGSGSRGKKDARKVSDSDSSSGDDSRSYRGRPSLTADIFTKRRSGRKHRTKEEDSSDGSDSESRIRDNPHSGDYLNNIMDEARKPSVGHSMVGSVPILQVRPEVTRETLRLYGTPPTIHDLIDFFGRFEDEQQKSLTPLKLATFLGETYRASLERLIAENEDGYAEHMYAAVGRRGHILKGGQQVISNKQVAELMRRSVMPTSDMQMMAILTTSVYPGSHWEFFRTEESILKNIKTYYQLWLTYLRNWDILLDLLGPASKYMPRYVITQKRNKGLVDYLIDGAPNRDFARFVYQRGIPEADRTDTLTWQKFNELYLKALRKIVRQSDAQKDFQRRYTLKDEISKAKPPLSIQRKQEKALRDSASVTSTNAMGIHVWPDVQEEFIINENAEAEPPDIEEYYATADKEDINHSDILGELRIAEEPLKPTLYNDVATIEEVVIDRVFRADANTANGNDWLCAIPTKDGMNLVCWKFAATGKCSYMDRTGKCAFSHAPEDVKRWRAVRELGPEGVQQINKMAQVRFSPSKAGGLSRSGPGMSIPQKSFGPARLSASSPTSRQSRLKA